MFSYTFKKLFYVSFTSCIKIPFYFQSLCICHLLLYTPPNKTKFKRKMEENKMKKIKIKKNKNLVMEAAV